MRWVEFIQVMISEEGGQLKVAKTNRIISAEAVYSIIPGAIPSEVMGPGGTPVGVPAAVLILIGEQILVECTVSQALYKLTWEGIKVEGPQDVSDGEYVVTKTVKRPKPEDLESKSNLIV